MLKRLQESKKYKKEIREFRECIDNLDNQELKNNANSLLSQLILHLNVINETHNILSNKSINPRKIRENVESAVQIRQKLKKLVKDSRSH